MSELLSAVYLARHGETAWSLSGQHTGRTDLPLTEHGERNARALGRRLRGLRFAKVFTSPLKRTARTCELAGFGGAAEIDPTLVEWDYGQYEGLRTADIHAEASPSRASGWSSLTTLWGFPCCARFPCARAAASTPVQRLGVVFAHLTQPYQPSRNCSRVGLHIDLFEACSAFTRVAARTLAPSPIRDLLHRVLAYDIAEIAKSFARNGGEAEDRARADRGGPAPAGRHGGQSQRAWTRTRERKT